MPDLDENRVEPVGGFQMRGMMMRYNAFMPRLLNWCISLGFEAGKILPSRAFCSDESQGYPVIMIAKHFGAFPFDHGHVGGIVATDLHGPHAEHGQNLVIIQASHVGYDPESKSFGTYRRLQTTNQECGPNCGKLHDVISWYQREYQFAWRNIQLHTYDGRKCIIVDNLLLHEDRNEGLLLRLDKLIDTDPDGQRRPLRILSTAQVFRASPTLVDKVSDEAFSGPTPQPIGPNLSAELFYFRRNISEVEASAHQLELNLIRTMPQIITSRSPSLTAAQINTQIQFDHTFRSIIKKRAYRDKKLLFIAGLNIDISPQAGQVFPLTKFVPWAASIQDRDGSYVTLEQNELMQALENQSTDNPNQIDLEAAIQIMAEAEEVKVEF